MIIKARLQMTNESRNRFKQDMQRFTNVSDHLRRPTDRIVGDALTRAFTENFESEGNGTWRPLSEAWTVPERRRLGFAGHHPILQRTGSLKQSLVNRRHSRHFRAISSNGAGRLRLQIGSTDIRYNLLHFGGQTRFGRVPARPMAVLHPHQENRIHEAARWAVDQALGIR